MKRWFVVQTNPKEDEIACLMMRQADIPVYQPFMQRYVFHARKKTLKKYPLFPNYLFVNIVPEEQSFYQVRWCRGVRQLLLNNYDPVPIDDGFIQGLKEMEDDSTGIIKKPVDFKAGDAVRVKSGPLRDIYGVIESWDSDAGRVRILVDMVNNRAKMVVHPSLIEKA